MGNRQQLTAARWSAELSYVRQVARLAGQAIRADFGVRRVLQYRGMYDVQLRADIVAQQVIVEHLRRKYPTYGIVAEEGMQRNWSGSEMLWVVDPLDGTNNFGYGVAHCAVVLTLFAGESVVLAVVYDPILDREFYAAEQKSRPQARLAPVSADRATVSLVTDYSDNGRQTGLRVQEKLSGHCKRVISMWAPGLDLALIADGHVDAMVCSSASLLDVCAGLFLVREAGGHVLDESGRPMEVQRSMHDRSISFVAAMDQALAWDLLAISSKAT